MFFKVIQEKITAMRKKKKIRKQMKMDRQCTKEFEALLGLMGKDLGQIEIIDATKWELDEEEGEDEE